MAIHEIYYTVQKAKENEDSLEILINQQKKLNDVERDHQMRQGFKWYFLFITSIITGFLLYFFLIPMINLMFVTSKDNQLLYDEILKIVPDSPLSEAITDDFMVLSWDLNNRDPYILSKKLLQEVERYKKYDSLSKATLMSATNPFYFKPFADENSVFISGNAIAESPAMYAFLYATEAGEDPSNI